jgi:ribose transport system substrate-binding protein
MDLSAQVSNLNTWLTKKPGAVVSFPMDPAAIESIAAGFRSQGSIWVTYGGDLQNQDASLQFSFYDSGYALGKNAGEWANAHLAGKGKVLLLIDDTIQLGRERSRGIVDGLTATAPGVQVVAKQQGITPEQGMSVTNSVLSQNPDVNIVLAAAGDAAQGAYQSLITAGRAANDASTYVGGLDGNLALTTIDPVKIGNAVIDVPLDKAAGTLPDGVFNVDVALVTADYPGLDALITAFGG